MKKTCNIDQLKSEFPRDSFEPWTSEGEALLAKHGCDIISIPSKGGNEEHLIGNRVNSTLFLADGYIQTVRNYDDEKDQWLKELGKLNSFRWEKIVITGKSGTGLILSKKEAKKVKKNIKDALNRD